jgi:hypothetical protein
VQGIDEKIAKTVARTIKIAMLFLKCVTCFLHRRANLSKFSRQSPFFEIFDLYLIFEIETSWLINVGKALRIGNINPLLPSTFQLYKKNKLKSIEGKTNLHRV